MNFVAYAQSICANPATSAPIVAGVFLSALVLWKGGKAIFSAIKTDIEHDRELKEKVASLPRPAPWISPQERARL